MASLWRRGTHPLTTNAYCADLQSLGCDDPDAENKGRGVGSGLDTQRCVYHAVRECWHLHLRPSASLFFRVWLELESSCICTPRATPLRGGLPTLRSAPFLMKK